MAHSTPPSGAPPGPESGRPVAIRCDRWRRVEFRASGAAACLLAVGGGSGAPARRERRRDALGAARETDPGAAPPRLGRRSPVTRRSSGRWRRGLALSAVGDVLIQRPGGFLAGLAFFLAAHLAYTTGFWRATAGTPGGARPAVPALRQPDGLLDHSRHRRHGDSGRRLHPGDQPDDVARRRARRRAAARPAGRPPGDRRRDSLRGERQPDRDPPLRRAASPGPTRRS